MQLVRWRKVQASDLVTARFESWILNLFHTTYVIVQLYIAAQVLSVLTGKMGIITWSTLQHHWGLKKKVGFPGGSDSKEFPWVGKIPWRRERLPTPVLLSGEFHGQKSLTSYSPWGCKQFDTTEQLSRTHSEQWVCVLLIYVCAAAAAAAKSLQLCPPLCDPIDGSPPGSPVPGILQVRILEWVAISFSSAWKWKVKVKSLSHVRPSATPWTAAHQAPPSMGFSRQEY